MDKPVLIFGNGPLTLAAIEIFEGNGNVVYGILDDSKSSKDQMIGDVSVLSGTNDTEYTRLVGDTCEAFIALDDNAVRKSLVKLLTEERKAMPVNGVHKTATISEKAFIGHGNFIGQAAQLVSGAEIGNHCILHPASVIGANATIGNFVQVGQNSSIGMDSKVEDEAFIGAGVTIVPGITIGKGARVGAGSVVVDNVEKGTTVFGNPAQKVQV